MAEDIPAVARVEEHFRREILAGERVPGARLPSIRVAARNLSVHHLTVRDAYHRLAADGLVNLRGGVGAFVADTAAGAELLICTRASEESDSHGAMLTRAIADHHRIRDFPIGTLLVRRGDFSFLSSLKARAERGILAGVWLHSLAHPLAQKAEALLAGLAVPVVHISNRPDKGYVLGVDLLEGIRSGTRWLLGQGCRRPALLCFAADMHPERAEAFTATCEALGVRGEILGMPYDDEAAPASFERYGSRTVRTLFERPRPPDGLMIADDGIGRGAFTALLQQGVRVPEDVRVCTHSRKGSSFPDIFGMPVARVELDESGVADAACRLMDQLVAREEPEERHVIVRLRLVAPEGDAPVSEKDGAAVVGD